MSKSKSDDEIAAMEAALETLMMVQPVALLLDFPPGESVPADMKPEYDARAWGVPVGPEESEAG